MLGGYQYSKVLNESIQVVREDIAFDLATAQVLAAQKKIETLKKFGFKDLRVVSETSDINEQQFFETRVLLTVDGTLVGCVIDRPSIITLMHFVLGSTYLSVLFITLFIFIGLIVVVPLARYKRDVQKFIKKAKEMPLDEVQTQQVDEVTSQIREIINLNTNYAMKIHQLDFEIKEKEAVAVLAKQVAHDIRSPLSILNMLIPSLQQDYTLEKCDLLLQATQRIDGIAEDLLKQGKLTPATKQVSVEDVSRLIAEKQTLLAKNKSRTRIELKDSIGSLFKTKITKLDFERITSNLLNNALEAIADEHNGIVELGLSAVDNSTVLVIKDNGPGIPVEVLSKIGTKGFSSGKIQGNGLGVFHAKSTVENAGGHFEIASTVGKGTTITITM